MGQRNTQVEWDFIKLYRDIRYLVHCRFSDKNQKAIDLLRTKCLKLKSMVLCDGRLYEIMKGNFERADRKSVIRTTVNSRVTLHYLLTNHDELMFG